MNDSWPEHAKQLIGGSCNLNEYNEKHNEYQKELFPRLKGYNTNLHLKINKFEASGFSWISIETTYRTEAGPGRDLLGLKQCSDSDSQELVIQIVSELIVKVRQDSGLVFNSFMVGSGMTYIADYFASPAPPEMLKEQEKEKEGDSNV